MEHLLEKGPEGTINECTSGSRIREEVETRKEVKGSQIIVGIEGMIQRGIR